MEDLIRDHDDPDQQSRELTIKDLTLKVCHRRDNTIKVDCNCDSQYMLVKIDRVWESIGQAYCWLTHSDPCYLVVDNTGGHGGDEAIANMLEG